MSLVIAKVNNQSNLRKAMMRILGLLCCLFVLMPSANVLGDPPNVLMIAIDDLNDWVGCLQGHPQTLTPNIDRLAERGVLFANAHCASPACNPSRAIVFSGRMPWHTGVWSNESKRLFQQQPDIPVIPRSFNEAGYATLGTGKLMHSSQAANRMMFEQHFNPEQRWSPFTREQVRYQKSELSSKGTSEPRHIVSLAEGKEVVLPLNGMPSDRNPQTPAGESFDWGPLNVPDAEMGDTQITDWAISKLKAGFGGRPFFLGVGYYRPHIPLFAPARYFERFNNQNVELPPFLEGDLDDLSPVARQWAIEPVTAGRHSTVVTHHQWHHAVKAYLACVTFVDHQIGRLLNSLDKSAFGENTVVVLWSDHGWHLGEKQHWGKWTGWERSTRVPLIVVPPKNQRDHYAAGGSTCDIPVSLLDVYPTLLELCEVNGPRDLEGSSLVPLLRDANAASDRHAVTVFDRGNVSVRSSQWRYIRYADGSEELYDMTSDPNEWRNLANEKSRAAVVESFRNLVPRAALAE